MLAVPPTSASGQDVSVFDNGLALERTEWISKGRLARLQYHRAAAKSGVEPAVLADNLVLELPGADSSIEDLVSRVEHGLLLTCLWYIREVDPATLLLTGLTRDGVYLVEKGEIVGSVNNFRFNESPVDLLSKTVEAGRTERALSRVERMAEPYRHATASSGGLQHELCQPGDLSQFLPRSGNSSAKSAVQPAWMSPRQESNSAASP